MSKPKNSHLLSSRYTLLIECETCEDLHAPGKYTCLKKTSALYSVHNMIEDRIHSYHRTRREAEIEQASVIRRYKQLESSGWPTSAFKSIW